MKCILKNAARKYLNWYLITKQNRKIIIIKCFSFIDQERMKTILYIQKKKSSLLIENMGNIFSLQTVFLTRSGLSADWYKIKTILILWSYNLRQRFVFKFKW